MISFKSFDKNIKNRKFNSELFLLILILFLASFLRLYRIGGYLTFLGDEGRDGLVWLRMIRNGKFTLIGPQTSIGNMYLGPLYYYLMLPFYLVFGIIGPSIGVAFFGILTTFLLWYFGKSWFSQKVGLASAFFYAISPTAIIFSRSSWNPNVMPFFSILTIWGVWQCWQKDNFVWLPVIGITLSFAIQSHYLGLLLIPVVGIFYLFKLKEILTKKNKMAKSILALSVAAAILFGFLTIVPLIWFDLRHNFINFQAFYKFFSERQTTVNFKFYKAIPNLWPLWEMGVTRLLAGRNEFFGLRLSLFLGFCLVFFLFHKKQILFKQKALLLVMVWLVIGLLGMGLYKQHIYDHYFGFLFPAFFLLLGWVIFQPAKFHGWWKYLSWLLLAGITLLNWQENPQRYLPNSQMAKVQEIDQKIISEAKGQKYNFALIAKQNYEAGYEYFLELWGRPPVQIDPQEFKKTSTEQLFVVCEDPVCEPTTNSKAGIANFGWSEIENEWVFPWGVKLFKLVHAQRW